MTRCKICKGEIPKPAALAGDPYCSTKCCRADHGLAPDGKTLNDGVSRHSGVRGKAPKVSGVKTMEWS